MTRAGEIWDPVGIRARIAALARADRALGVFGAATHRWTLEPPWEPARLEAFEDRHGVHLPDDYGAFVTHVASAGAGPGHGLWPPGLHGSGRSVVSWEGTPQAVALGKPFPHPVEYPASQPRGKARVQGSLPLASFGDVLVARLVVTGPERGRIWIDDAMGNTTRDESGGFGEWYLAWLSGAEEAVTERDRAPDVPRPPTERREVHDEAVAREVARVREGLPKGAVMFGAVGRFSWQPALVFVEGTALARAVWGTAALPSDDAGRVFGAALAVAREGAVAVVPGLFSLWLRRTWGRDALGRRTPLDEAVVEPDPGLRGLRKRRT